MLVSCQHCPGSMLQLARHSLLPTEVLHSQLAVQEKRPPLQQQQHQGLQASRAVRACQQQRSGLLGGSAGLRGSAREAARAATKQSTAVVWSAVALLLLMLLLGQQLA